MTRALGRDPARRRLRLTEWPEADALVWRAALLPGDVLEPGGERARHAALSNRAVEGGYGRWLAWLQHNERLDATTPPADRITPASVRDFVADLSRYNSSATQQKLLGEIRIMADLLDPMRDWQWIRDAATRVRWYGRPVRDKRARLVGADDLCTLGFTLMQAADQEPPNTKPWQRALCYRDGLILAVLAQRPLRRANFANLQLGQHILRRGSVWWICLDAGETKTRSAIEVPWPKSLQPALEVYLETWRPILVGRHVPASTPLPPAGNALWLSVSGAPMGTQALFDLTTKRTAAAFGKAVNPHLFRDAAAATIAVEDPANIGVASQVLGHRSQATTERHYNQERTVDAAQRWQTTLERIRAERHTSARSI